jgi:hypothetical protein
MAWNPSPEVAIARDVAKKTGDEGVIIIRFPKVPGDVYSIASYGKDRERCADMGRVLDQIDRLLQSGEIVV